MREIAFWFELGRPVEYLAPTTPGPLLAPLRRPLVELLSSLDLVEGISDKSGSAMGVAGSSWMGSAGWTTELVLGYSMVPASAGAEGLML